MYYARTVTLAHHLVSTWPHFQLGDGEFCMREPLDRELEQRGLPFLVLNECLYVYSVDVHCGFILVML